MLNKIKLIILSIFISLLLYSCNLFDEGFGDKVDMEPPALTILSHNNGDFESGSFTISGEVIDDTGVTKVTAYYVNKDHSITSSPAVVTGAKWSLTFNPADNIILGEGEFDVQIVAVDSHGKSVEKRIMLFLDNSAPNIKFLSPQSDQVLNGDVTVGGSANDGNGSGIKSIEYKVGYNHPHEEWVKAEGSPFNWYIEFKDTKRVETFAVIGEAVDSDNDQIWELPVIMKIVDNAGNVLITGEDDFRLFVDPTGDAPRATILTPNPDEDNRTLGGPIRISGLAVDDDGVKEVFLQIDTNGDGVYDNNDDAEWYNGGAGRLVDGKYSWHHIINEQGEFNPVIDDTKDINFRVRVKDIFDTIGPWSKSYLIQVDKNAPRIGNTNPLVFSTATEVKSYKKDMWITGNWNLNGTIDDDSGISSIMLDGYVDGSMQVNPSWFSAVTKGFDLNVPITTGSSGSGSILLRITAYDDATPINKTSKTLEVNYDNDIPKLDSYMGINPIKNSESTGVYVVESKLEEIGSGLKRVQFYFKKGTKIYNPMFDNRSEETSSLELLNGIYYKECSGAATRDSTTSITHTSFIGNDYVKEGGIVKIGGLDRRIESVSGATITIAEEVPTTFTEVKIAYTMVVDHLAVESGSFDDGDGLKERIERDNTVYNWGATIDSSNIPDGPVELIIVAEDKAGNIVSETVETTVENNGPKVKSIKLWTDLDSNGSVDTGEISESYNVPVSTITDATNFSFRDNSYFKVVVDNGNGAKKYNINNGALKAFPVDGIIHISKSDIKDLGKEDSVKDFKIKVWDSTLGTTPGLDSLNHEVTIRVNIDVEDGIKPQSVIKPFFWTSVNDNSLAGNSKTNGHIELELNKLGDSDPKVSGKVVIRGTSTDDQRIKDIYLNIDGMTSMANNKVIDGKNYTKISSFDNTKPKNFTETNGFKIISQVMNQESHTVNWEYVWDTSLIETVTKKDVVFRLASVDKGDNISTVVNYKVDVVPYISEIIRNAPFTMNRTKFGRYPLQEDETGVIVKGFNLSSATASISVNTSDISTIEAATGGLKIKMTGVNKSGKLELIINGIPSLNNINDNSDEINKIDDGSGLSNTNWNDDVYIRVWETGNSFFESSNAGYPSMALAVTGELVGAWTDNGASALYTSTMLKSGLKSSSKILKFQYYDDPKYTDIALYNDSKDSQVIGFLADFVGSSSWPDTGSSTSAGNIALSTEYSSFMRRSSGGYKHKWYRGEGLYRGKMLNQFLRPKVATYNDNETRRQHMTYYDRETNSIKYIHFTEESNIDSVNYNEKTTWINIDGGSDTDDAIKVTNGEARSTAAGSYMSIDYDENGYPVIMYYDIKNQTLRLAYANKVNPTSAADWTRQNVFKSDDPNRKYVGEHVAIKIERTATKAISHAVAKTITGKLVYLKAGDADNADYTFTSEVIDSSGSVGNFIDISLNGSNPYISYINNMAYDTVDGLKLAYIDSKNANNWEYEIIPAAVKVRDERTSIEYKNSNTTWGDLAIGYLSDKFELVYLKSE